MWVAAGGAVGASLRFLSTSLIKYLLPSLPVGTLFVNIVGSFLIGFLIGYMENKNISSYIIRYFIVIGILGSFTTFSAFSYDLIEMFNNKKVYISIFYMIISIISCILFCYIGYNFNKS